MAMQRYTMKLTQLHCIKQTDSNSSSEPYIWVTYFALGPQLSQFETGPLALSTPAFDAFRTEFADGVTDGSVIGIPPFIASSSFDMDLEVSGPKLLGCVAVLLEEDDTRSDDIVRGRIAYSKEMEKQLNSLIEKRISQVDPGPLTDDEKETIRVAVKSKVTSAVGSQQSFFDVLRNQDDTLGFTHVIFSKDQDHTISATTFDFPEITATNLFGTVTDRYVLSGEVTVGPVPPDTTKVCARQRKALDAKREQIKSLHNRVTLMQQQLAHATPQQKSGIVQEIKATNNEISLNEAQLPALETALSKCLASPPNHVDPLDPVVVKHTG